MEHCEWSLAKGSIVQERQGMGLWSTEGLGEKIKAIQEIDV